MSVVSLEQVGKRFGKQIAVRDFNLSVHDGEFVSFLGGSGCGKTTTLRMVAGFEHPDQGRIMINGQDMAGITPNRRQIGMVFQNYALFPNMNVAQNIAFGLKVAGLPRAQRSDRVAEMLSLIHMADFAQRYPWQLSGGQQQRVALARALATRPKVLLLDEPLSALDAKIRSRLGHEIRSIQQSLGITTIYVTHDQEEALALSDRIVVMHEGGIEQVASPFEIYNRPASPFVASFIGTLNLLDATVIQAAEGRLEVAGQEVRCSTHADLPAGRLVGLALRPEMLSLSPGDAAANQLQGSLQTVNFLGSVVRLTVKLGRHELCLDTFNNPHLELPSLNSPVSVYFAPESCLIVNHQKSHLPV